MKKIRFFAALCCAATIFTACDKNDEPANGHEYVDLGLSVKWATCNIGAFAPDRCGNYYAWGETEPKKNYDWDTYKHCVAYWFKDDWEGWLWETITKYNTNGDFGKVDNKITLETADDAAAKNWGGAWRIPTQDEWQELIDNCYWEWTDDYNGKGVAGNIVTSKSNGNSIFFPITGYYNENELRYIDDGGFYWSSSLNTEYPGYAVYFYIENDYLDGVRDNGIVWRERSLRCCGLPIRPVLR